MALDIVYTCIYNASMFLFEVVDAIDKAKIKYAIVGGYALALHGLVRATVDIDLVLSLKISDFEAAEKCMKDIGLTSRIPVSAKDVINMRKEYIENRNLVAWSFVDFKNPTKVVDILITKDVKDFDVIKVSVEGRKISVCSLRDLLKMKQEAGRPQDKIDVENIKLKIAELKNAKK